MIVKDEIQDVVRIIKHYGSCFEKIYITVTHDSNYAQFKELPTLMDEYNSYISISKFDWVKDFSKARNFSFEQADTDYIFWMDADDALFNPENLRKLVETYADVDMFYLNYKYAFDESGNCIMEHKRERLIRNNKQLYWKGRVHESLVPIEDVQLSRGEATDCYVIHQTPFEHTIESHKRNLEILVNEYNENRERTDPRTISYLAGELTALRRFDEAIKFYEKHIALSGWPEDKFLSWQKIAQNLVSMFLDKKDPSLLNTAISALVESTLTYPEIPDSYLTIGECYWHLKEWNKCIEWTNMGLSKRPPTNLPYNDPTRYTIRPLPILGYAYLNLGEIDKAYKYMRKALELAPKNAFIKDNYPFFERVYNETQVFKNFVNIAKYLEANDKSKLPLLSSIIPDDVAGDDRFIQLRNRYSTPKCWNDKSVVIYCGMSAEEWAPPSVLKGIGGSEEAVIYLGKELTALGYNVTVYGNCGEMEGNYEGVEYKNFWHFNKKDVFNVIISWRQNIFNAGVFGKRKLVWLHDVPFKNDWTNEAYENVDKVIVLSNYHKTLMENAPEDKLYVSTNGINVSDFVAVDAKGINRNPNRIIYGSSYNRGLEHILDMWPEIRKECPLAELHIFYGWNTFDAMNSDNEDLMKWKQQLVQKMQQPGIKDHGRVGHKKLLEEYAKSSIWAYPTFFKEINCITALKSTASGCWPVFMKQFALVDTCKYGWGVEPKAENVMLAEFKVNLINALKQPQQEADLIMMKQSVRDKYDWKNVAKDWSENLFEDKPICISDTNEPVAEPAQVTGV